MSRQGGGGFGRAMLQNVTARSRRSSPTPHDVTTPTGTAPAEPAVSPAEPAGPLMMRAQVIKETGLAYLEPTRDQRFSGLPWPRPTGRHLWRYLDVNRPLNPRLGQALTWPLSVSPAGLQMLLDGNQEGTVVQLTGLPAESGPDSRVLARTTRLPDGQVVLEIRERRSLCVRHTHAERIYLMPELKTRDWQVTHENDFDEESGSGRPVTSPCEAALWGAAWLSGDYVTSNGQARWEGQGLSGVHQHGQQQTQPWTLADLPAHPGNPLGSLILRQGTEAPRELSLAQGARFLLALN